MEYLAAAGRSPLQRSKVRAAGRPTHGRGLLSAATTAATTTAATAGAYTPRCNSNDS